MHLRPKRRVFRVDRLQFWTPSKSRALNSLFPISKMRDFLARWRVLQKCRNRTGRNAVRQNTGLNSAGPQRPAAGNDRLKPWRHGVRGKSTAETCANQPLLAGSMLPKKTKNYLSIAQAKIIIILFNSKWISLAQVRMPIRLTCSN